MDQRVFGPYELLELVGRGGMGEVFRAYDRVRERTVALKLLHRNLEPDAEYLERFRRESRAAARLSSPHVIPIHDYGEIDGRLFIDMRLAHGHDLGTILERQGALAPARAVEITSQVASALDAAHGDGLIHRDVKPSNVLVSTERGRDFAYLVDFGIVRAFDGRVGQSLTATGSIIGTPAYMAPEVFAGERLDRGVDVYALACLLHEALAGHPPFRAPSLPAMIHQHLHATPPALDDLRPGLPRGLGAALAWALAKRPDQRPTSAGEFAEAVRAALDTPVPRVAAPQRSVPTLLGPAAAREAVRPLPEPNGQPLHAVAYSPDGELLGGVLAEPGGAVVLDAETGEVATWLPDDRQGSVIAFAPDGATVATGTNRGHAGEVLLWDIATGALRGEVARHDGVVSALAFSPDGRLLATAGKDRTAAVWDVATGGPLMTCALRHPVRDLAVSPDGTWLATAGRGVHLFGIRATRRARAALHLSTDDIAWAVAFGPDGLTLATAGADGLATTWHLGTGDALERFPHEDEVLDVRYSLDGRTLLTAAADGTATAWDLGRRGQPRHVTLTDEVYQLAVHPRRHGAVAALTADGLVHLVELR